MSVDATIWAWKFNKQQVSSSEKLVLLSLSDRADEHFECYPSKERLSADTTLDRKTIFTVLASLEKKSIICKTGNKKGRLKNIDVYRLIGVQQRHKTKQTDKDSISTENGTIDDDLISNRTENGILNSTENGTVNRTENGIQNLSVEPNILTNNKSTPAAVEGGLKCSSISLFSDNPHQIPQQMISDWITNRKAKKSPITKTAWTRLNNQLAKVSNPIEAFEEMVSRGWLSFNADWVVNTTAPNKAKSLDGYDRNNTSWADGLQEDLF